MNLNSNIDKKLLEACEEYKVDSKLAYALIEASTRGIANFCSFSKHSQQVSLFLDRPVMCDIDTEFVMQRMRWGLFGIFGFIARSAGFDGWLPILLNASPNIEYGVKHIARLSIKYQGDDLISAYNHGSPRSFAGGYANSAFVQKVKSAL